MKKYKYMKIWIFNMKKYNLFSYDYLKLNKQPKFIYRQLLILIYYELFYLLFQCHYLQTHHKIL